MLSKSGKVAKYYHHYFERLADNFYGDNGKPEELGKAAKIIRIGHEAKYITSGKTAADYHRRE